MKKQITIGAILVFFFALIIYQVPDAQALSIFDYASCKNIYEKWKIIGSYTYAMTFGNFETARFCMSMFEKDITLREIKDHHENPLLGLEIDLPKNWSGFELFAENMTIAFVTPDKKKSKPIEPLWMMLVVADKSIIEENSNKISKLAAESLDDVPNYMKTCNFKEPTIIEINEKELKVNSAVCIDRRLSLFVTISAYSFDKEENEIFLVSATRHLPSYFPDHPIIDSLQTLKIEMNLNNTANSDIPVSETKKSDLPFWFHQYVSLWGMEKITDKEFISTMKFLLRNNILSDTQYSKPGFYNQAKIPDWFRENAILFGKGLISDDEFRTSFEYLLENRIIVI